MGVNLDRMRKAKEQADSKQRGGVEFWQVPEGENLIYICPPFPGDELPFVETAVHYEVGPESKMAMCLDAERNPVLQDHRIKKLVAGRGKNYDDGCHACKKLDEGVNVAKKASSRYFWPIIPLKYRKASTKKWREADDADELRILSCGYTVWSGIMDVFINNGDITEPDKAILVRVVREGKGMTTKYTVTADADSVRAGGVSMSKAIKALIRNQIAEGESGDLYKIVSNMVRSSDEVEAMVEGVQLEDANEGESSSDKKPECFGLEYEANEKECLDCSYHDDCKEVCTPPGNKPTEAIVDEPAEVDDTNVPLSAGNEVRVKDCVVDDIYSEDDDEIVPLTFKGTSKKGRKVWGFFEDEGGERLRLGGSEKVFEVVGDTIEEPGNETPDAVADDDDLAALDAAIASRKKRTPPSRPASGRP